MLSACSRRFFFGLQQLPDDVLQNSAVTVILRLLRRIDAQQRLELHDGAILARGFDLKLLARLEVVDQLLDSRDFKSLFAGQSERLRVFAGRELSGRMPIPTRFER